MVLRNKKIWLLTWRGCWNVVGGLGLLRGRNIVRVGICPPRWNMGRLCLNRKGNLLRRRRLLGPWGSSSRLSMCIPGSKWRCNLSNQLRSIGINPGCNLFGGHACCSVGFCSILVLWRRLCGWWRLLPRCLPASRCCYSPKWSSRNPRHLTVTCWTGKWGKRSKWRPNPRHRMQVWWLDWDPWWRSKPEEEQT